MAAEPATDAAKRIWQRFDSLVNWERSARAAMRVDLSPELDLMARMGEPHLALRTVHVTGTKGKGSVCSLIEAGLLQAGHRAGRYASPHIEHLSERVSLMGQPISDAEMLRALESALDARDVAVAEGSAAREATWFDVITAAAFRAFVDAGLEWAVIEVGLGGRLDSTNVVLPEVAVITNIGLEHTDVLGPTVEHIATEKAGIIKAGRPAVTTVPAQSSAGRVLRERAAAVDAPLVWVETSLGAGLLAANTMLARAALDQLGLRGFRSLKRDAPLGAADLSEAAVRRSRLPGRLEVFQVAAPQGRPPVQVVLDGAHVGFALTAVVEQLRQNPALAGPMVVLLAIGADKPAADIVARLKGLATLVVCTQLAGGRPSWGAAALVAWCRAQDLAAEAVEEPLPGLARCLGAVHEGAPGSWLLVTGSLHLVGAVRSSVRAAAIAQDPATHSEDGGRAEDDRRTGNAGSGRGGREGLSA